MYIHLGENTLVKSKDIIGIFDLDNATVMKSTRNYLKKATSENRIINVSYELPKSFTVTAENKYTVYISLLSPQTLYGRIKNKNKSRLYKE
jgi:hypothetical protein